MYIFVCGYNLPQTNLLFIPIFLPIIIMKIFLYKIKQNFVSIGNKGKLNDIFFHKKPTIFFMKRAGGNIYHVFKQFFLKVVLIKKYFFYFNYYKIEKFFTNLFSFYFNINIKKKGNNLGFFLNKNFILLKFLFISFTVFSIYFVINIMKNIYLLKDIIVKHCNFNKITINFFI